MLKKIASGVPPTLLCATAENRSLFKKCSEHLSYISAEMHTFVCVVFNNQFSPQNSFGKAQPLSNQGMTVWCSLQFYGSSLDLVAIHSTKRQFCESDLWEFYGSFHHRVANKDNTGFNWRSVAVCCSKLNVQEATSVFFQSENLKLQLSRKIEEDFPPPLGQGKCGRQDDYTENTLNYPQAQNNSSFL